MVRDSIGSTDSYHGRGKIEQTKLHALTRIAMLSTMAGWPPVSGHSAMVALEMQL